MARSLGIRWAESVVQRNPSLLHEPWPSTPKAAEIARRKIASMSHDVRVLEHLLTEVQHDAARRWAQLQRDPVAVERVLAIGRGNVRERKRAAERERNQ